MPKVIDDEWMGKLTKQQRYYLRHKAKIREMQRRYEMSERGKEVRKAIRERYKANKK